MSRAESQQVGDYRLITRIGQGGQGEVYRAQSPAGAEVAVKILHAMFSGDPDARRRFFREVELARRVAPFCTARVLDVGLHDNRPYIVSEYVPGLSLTKVVQQDGPRTGGGLERLAVATATALAAIHRAGVVHRDFKPSNVIMGPEGPVVIDFGISRALDHTVVTQSGTMGTPGYMAPEQISSGQVGPAADVFSWAATIVFAATGHPAFPGDTVPVLIHGILYGEPNLTGLPEGLRPLIAACLAKDPERRPTFAAIVATLTGDSAPNTTPNVAKNPAEPAGTEVVSGPLTLPAPEPVTTQTRRRGVRAPALIAVALAVAVAVVAVVQFWPDGQDNTGPARSSTTLEASPGSPSSERTGAAFGAPVGKPVAVHKNDVRAIALGRLGDEPISVSGSDDNTARVVDLNTGKQLGPALTGHTGWVRAVAITELDGEQVAVTGSDDGTALVWNLRTRERVGAAIPGNPGGIKALATGELGGEPIVVTAGVDKALRIWNLRTREPIGQPLTGHRGTVWGVALGSLDGTPIAVSASDDATVRVWDLNARQQLGANMTGHTGWVRSVALGALNGTPIALTGGEDKTARVWDLTTHKELGSPLTGHTAWVWSVALGEIGGTPVALTGSEDNTARIWDLNSRRQLGPPLTGHDDCVWTVTLGTLDGRPVAVTGSKDETIRIWDLTPPLPPPVA
ncbi:WD40 repeat domain-containing serine/threonine protein kinase [Acrocarpospora catenulata]|uniref:WD40 repeat domain-containing serine/threonine protein kinase n=1 Tax=Acrocarpospora catenulata TaxID=2836182 RepID=UPI001BD9C602|nr:serine/threonine-protein kinase [Acrocarpospora catenulata]